jgi:hypothetical protein
MRLKKMERDMAKNVPDPLNLFDPLNLLKSRWEMSEAELMINQIFNKRVSVIGGMLFWIGLVISIVSYLAGLSE